MSGTAARSRSAWSAAAAGLVLATGCASTPPMFQRYVEAGLYDEAARTFERDSTLWNRPETLLLAARMFADPSLPSHDAARARSALERLVTVFPASAEATQGAVLLPLVARVEEMAVLKSELDARTAEVVQLRAAQADTLAAAQAAAEAEFQVLRRRIQRLEAELERAREELERLKAIDLRRRPDGRR